MTFDMTAAAIGFAREALLAGEPETALGVLRPVVAQGGATPEARYWLASALMASGDESGAEAALADAQSAHALALAAARGADVERCRTDGDYAAAIAGKLYQTDHVAMASAIFALAQAAGHAAPVSLVTYALALQHQGRPEEAIAAFRGVLASHPSPVAHAFMLYPHLLLDDDGARYAAEARAWSQRWSPPAGGACPARPIAGRKLRVGYVAPNFTGTQVRQFIAPVLDAHDRTAVEVFLYPAKAETETAWTCPLNIRPIGHLADADAAALVRQDGIDVLVDCWGHSAGNRLAVFAHRPAPVQAAWINFIQTTGLGSIDHVLHAGEGEPVSDPQFTETIWPIGPVFNVFRPNPDRLPPAPTPALRTGRVTFGSFNHPCKLSDQTVRAWARILKAAPTSRLVLKYAYFADPVLQRVTQARFAGHGVGPDRIVFEGKTTGPEYLAAFQAIDLALDPSPAPGSTTTLEALSNGVPVLSLAPEHGTRSHGYTRSLALAAGLPELLAEDWDDYVRRAVALTADAAALDRLRARVRPGFDQGPLRDEIGFTRRVEQAFRTMVERRQQAADPTLQAQGAA